VKRLVFPLTVLSVLALGLWSGGLVVLGAIAAPLVFRMVPMPDAADAMAAVFARFDQLVIGLALTLLVSDGVLLLARRGQAFDWLDRLRPLATIVLCLLGIGEAMYITPRIAGLHAAGAVRGVGDSGMRLDALHDVAERLGKGQLLLAVLLVILHLRALDPLGRRRGVT
jgi:uncharacterized membrane protein